MSEKSDNLSYGSVQIDSMHYDSDKGTLEFECLIDDGFFAGYHETSLSATEAYRYLDRDTVQRQIDRVIPTLEGTTYIDFQELMADAIIRTPFVPDIVIPAFNLDPDFERLIDRAWGK